MATRIINKRVGDVEIFEIFGKFVGDFALQSKKAIEQVVQHNEADALLINTRNVEKIDRFGSESLLTTANFFKKIGLIEGGLSMKELLQSENSKHLSVFKDEDSAVQYFARELVKLKSKATGPERRRFPRLNAALPLHFGFQNEEGKKIELFGVVTNLSEGGLYAEFIDSSSEGAIREYLHPFDFRLLHLTLLLSSSDGVRLQGKMIHDNPAGGIGIEFYGGEEGSLEHMSEWLNRKKLQEETSL